MIKVIPDGILFKFFVKLFTHDNSSISYSIYYNYYLGSSPLSTCTIYILSPISSFLSRLFFYGDTLFSATASDSPYDLPIYLRIAQATRHDSILTIFALSEFRKLYPTSPLRTSLRMVPWITILHTSFSGSGICTVYPLGF